MIKLSLLNIYFISICILPGISVLIYLIVPVPTVKVFGGNITDQSTRDAAQLWVRTTSNGDILVSLLNGIALFKESDWPFRQLVIRVCSISNFVHFGCFLLHNYLVHPHHVAFVVLYYSALFMTALTGLGWGIDWNTILSIRKKNKDQLQLTTTTINAFNST